MTDRKRRAVDGSRSSLVSDSGRSRGTLSQRRQQALHAHRLDQIVDRMDLERRDRMLVIRGRENQHRRHRQLEQMPRQLDAVHVGHVDVGQHEVGRRRTEQRQRLATAARLADDAQRDDARAVVEQFAQPSPRRAPRRRRSALSAGHQPYALSRRPKPCDTACGYALRRSPCSPCSPAPLRHRNATPAVRGYWPAPSCCRSGAGCRTGTGCAGSRALRRDEGRY